MTDIHHTNALDGILPDPLFRAPLNESAAADHRPHQSPVPASCLLRIIRDVPGFRALETDWIALQRHSSGHRSVFQTFGWLGSWLSTCGASGGAWPLCIAAGYRGGRLVFAWPMARFQAGPLALLRWMSEPFAQYGDVIVRDGEDASFWMGRTLAELRSERRIDGIRLRHVRADAAAAPFLARTFRDSHFNEAAPWLDLTAFADDAAYDARYNSAQRKRRRKIRKALEDDFGPVTFELLRDGEAIATALARAIAEKSRWIEDRGRHNRILGTPRLVEFLATLAEAKDGVALVVSELRAGGQPVSWEIGLRCAGVHYGFITSHLNRFTGYSPARLHMDFSQRRALADGMRVFDLMLPHDAHKDSWSSAATAVNDYFLPLSPAGWAYGALYVERLRPLLRRAYHRMPPAMLRLLKPVVGH